MLSFIPKITFVTSELHQIAEKLNDPLLRKYLTYIASVEASDILENGEPKEGETADSFLRRQAEVRGKVAVIEALLSISPVGEAQSGANGNVAG